MQDNSEVRTDILANLTDPHIRSPAHFITFLLLLLLLLLLVILLLTHPPPLSALLLALSVQIRSCPALGNQISPPPCQPSCFILHKMAHIQQSRPTRLYVTFISSVRSSSVYHGLLEGSSSTHFFKFFKFFRFESESESERTQHVLYF